MASRLQQKSLEAPSSLSQDHQCRSTNTWKRPNVFFLMKFGGTHHPSILFPKKKNTGEFPTEPSPPNPKGGGHSVEGLGSGRTSTRALPEAGRSKCPSCDAPIAEGCSQLSGRRSLGNLDDNLKLAKQNLGKVGVIYM